MCLFTLNALALQEFCAAPGTPFTAAPFEGVRNESYLQKQFKQASSEACLTLSDYLQGQEVFFRRKGKPEVSRKVV